MLLLSINKIPFCGLKEYKKQVEVAEGKRFQIGLTSIGFLFFENESRFYQQQ